MIEKLILLETENNKTYYLSSINTSHSGKHVTDINNVYYWSQSLDSIVTDVRLINNMWSSGELSNIVVPPELKYVNYSIKLCKFKYNVLSSNKFETKLENICSVCSEEFIDGYNGIYCHICGTKRAGNYVKLD